MSACRYYNDKWRRLFLSGRVDLWPVWLTRHPRIKYIMAANLSAVEWRNKGKIAALRKEAQRLTADTGIQHVIDHEIPLVHPLVCGLSVHNNMRVVTYAVNAAKGNKWNPFQMELNFD